MKQLIFILLLTVSVFAANAQSFTANTLVYSINEDNVSVTVTGHVDGTEATGDIVIPDTVSYNGMDYSVTIIGEYAFNYSHKLHGTLTIGNNVTDIKRGAFKRCDSLSGNLIMPNSLINIGDAAFSDCDGFTGPLTIPNSVVYIGTCAFDQCDGFDGTLTIGNSVSNIGNGAFMLCSNISEAICLAMEPPTLGYSVGSNMSSVFYGFGCSTLIVPCGSKTKYENSPWHDSFGGFSTIIEDCENVLELNDNPIPVAIDIYSLDGRFVKSQTNNLNTVDISSLGTGVYIVKIRMADGKEFSERIVKE